MDLTVDELAERSGSSVRTIRYYQSEGLLPGPTRHGREARYGAAHVARLEAIADLQGRGLRLTAIADLLHDAEGDTAVIDWLGLGQRMVQPWSEDEPVLLSEAEMAERLADTPEDALEALVGTGLIERRSDTVPVVYFVASPGLLDVALQLVALGIDVETAAALRDLLTTRLRALATELVGEFTERVSLSHLADAGPAALTELLAALQPVTRRSVELTFAHEMERAQRALLDAAIAAAQPPEESS